MNREKGFTPLEIENKVNSDINMSKRYRNTSINERKCQWHFRSLTGFTIVELLTASAILLFVLTAVFSIYVMLSQYARDTSAQAVLQSRVRIAIEKIVRNIRLATAVDCATTGNSIMLTFDPTRMGKSGNSWTSRYRLVSDQILFSPDINSNEENVIIDNVKLDTAGKLFQYDEGKQLVTIDLRVENSTVTNKQNERLTTVVKVRNAD